VASSLIVQILTQRQSISSSGTQFTCFTSIKVQILTQSVGVSAPYSSCQVLETETCHRQLLYSIYLFLTVLLVLKYKYWRREHFFVSVSFSSSSSFHLIISSKCHKSDFFECTDAEAKDLGRRGKKKDSILSLLVLLVQKYNTDAEFSVVEVTDLPRQKEEFLYSIYLFYWYKSTDTDAPGAGRTLQWTLGSYYYQLTGTPWNLVLFTCPLYTPSTLTLLTARSTTDTLLRVYSGSIKSLFRLCSGSFQTLFRLYTDLFNIKALLSQHCTHVRNWGPRDSE
jgi:hypothetical protein